MRKRKKKEGNKSRKETRVPLLADNEQKRVITIENKTNIGENAAYKIASVCLSLLTSSSVFLFSLIFPLYVYVYDCVSSIIIFENKSETEKKKKN